jgi:hypothetical protein
MLRLAPLVIRRIEKKQLYFAFQFLPDKGLAHKQEGENASLQRFLHTLLVADVRMAERPCKADIVDRTLLFNQAFKEF